MICESTLRNLVDERHLKDNSVQAHINCLRSFFQWLTDEDAIRKNPMRKIKSLRIDKLRARHPLTAEQLELIRDGCKGYKEKALGRISGFVRLSVCLRSPDCACRDIDWQERKCKVIGKAASSALCLFLGEGAKLMLQLYIEGRKEERRSSPAAVRPTNL